MFHQTRKAIVIGAGLSRFIPSNKLKILATMFEQRILRDGDCQAGEPASCVFAIESGSVDVYLPGETTAVSRCVVWDIVGQYGMFLSGRRSATLRAAGPTNVLVLDYKHFKRFLLAFPESMMALFAVCVDRLNSRQNKVHNA